MKHRVDFYFVSFLVFGFLFSAVNCTAQSIAYRQTNLAASAPNVAKNVAPELVNPWGIAFLPGQPFFTADNLEGRVSSLDASGLSVSPGAFIVPGSSGTGFDSPTGIVADQNSSFGDASLIKPFILVTDQGAIFTWGSDAQGDIPQAATLVVNNVSKGAVYKGVAILSSSLTAPALAVTDFHRGSIETFLPGFSPVALSGPFTDPNLPAGYAPFGIQVIGLQVFVTYALQDDTKQNPIVGPGNGVVDIFDMDGNFLRRFVTGGPLNAPWGLAQASANFGPFSNDILVGNVGDGTINAFDPATGRFVGTLINGDGNALVEAGLHALTFRADGVGDPNTLYFASQLGSEQSGLFGAITPGLVSRITVSAADPALGASVTITANVAAGPNNPGTPAGTVTFLDGSHRLGDAPLLGSLATLDAIFTTAGIHTITAQYNGDGVFLPSTERISLQVAGLATMLTLTAPADAAPGSAVTLTATVTSPGGIPTGQIAFHDGNTDLGTAPLNDAAVAILRINTLAPGIHSLTASYDGDEKFGSSTSAAVTIDIANADFSLQASPSSASVTAGESTQFMLTVTPAGGFANNVTFSCMPLTAISCTFNPAAVNPANGVASTTLTVTTSASVSRHELLAPDGIGPWALIAAALFSLAIRSGQRIRTTNAPMLTATALLAIVGLWLVIGGCGGSRSAQTNSRNASVVVTGQSGIVSHATTLMVTVQ